jgi:PilZ domain
MTRTTTQYDLLAGGIDRRRLPRYACSGRAQISCLPLTGARLRGRLRDLGLGGCCIEHIETTSPFDIGARTEILVEVNSWFFRAMAQVRAVHCRSRISMEFMRMSAGGQNMLADLFAELERPRPVAIRREHPSKLLRSESSLAITGTIVPAQPVAAANVDPATTSIDIFV